MGGDIDSDGILTGDEGAKSGKSSPMKLDIHSSKTLFGKPLTVDAYLVIILVGLLSSILLSLPCIQFLQ